MGSKKLRITDSAARSLLNSDFREIKNLRTCLSDWMWGQLGSDASTPPNTQVKLPLTIFVATTHCAYGHSSPMIKKGIKTCTRK